MRPSAGAPGKMNKAEIGAPGMQALRALLAETMLRDRRVLQRELDRLGAAQTPDAVAMATWQKRADAIEQNVLKQGTLCAHADAEAAPAAMAAALAPAV